MSSCALLASRRWWRRTLITQNYGHHQAPKHFSLVLMIMMCLLSKVIFWASVFIVLLCFSWFETDGLTVATKLESMAHMILKGRMFQRHGVWEGNAIETMQPMIHKHSKLINWSNFSHRVWSFLMSTGDQLNANWVNPFNSSALWLREIDFVLLVWRLNIHESRVERTKRSQACAGRISIHKLFNE